MMKSSVLTRCWSAFGAVLMLTIALSNTSCCAHRSVADSQKTEAVETRETEAHASSEAHTQTEATLTGATQGQTWTEIEIYDTDKPADPETGVHPVKARVRQHSEQSGSVTATAQTEAEAKSEADSTENVQATTLDEVTVTATKTPSLWERVKQGAGWAVLVLTLAVAGWIIYKFRK